MSFADHLKALREKARLTQAALSTGSGLSLGVIRDYEQGKREPSLRSAVKLAGPLGVPVETLARGLGDEPQTIPQKGASGRPKKPPAGRDGAVAKRGRPKRK